MNSNNNNSSSSSNNNNTKMQHNQNVVPMISVGLPTEEVIQQAEKYINVLKRLRLAAVKLTNPEDWCNHNGAPYLEKRGCDKIAQAFGIVISSPTFEKEVLRDDKGEYILFTCVATGRWNNIESAEIGTASTRDDFFGKVGKQYKPLSEVNLTDVKKKAFTNLCNRLIKRLLGLSFTWEELYELSDGRITEETVKKIMFSGGGCSAKESYRYDTTQNTTPNTTQNTTNKREEINAMLMVLANGDPKEAERILINVSSFMGKDGNIVPGKSSVEKLSDIQVPIIYKKVKDLFNKHTTEKKEDK